MQNSNRTKRKNNVPNFTEFRVKKPSILFDFLRENLPKLSRNNIKSLLTHRQVAVEGVRITQFDFELSANDLVIVFKERKIESKIPRPKILFEDDEFLVIDKPSGLLSIASDKEKTKTAIKVMMEYVQDKNPNARLYITHRIDRDTSGVLMFTKREDLRNALQDRWNDLVSKRAYVAIVEGSPKSTKKTIKSWLHQTTTQLMYSRHEEDDEGQEAITHYEVMKTNGTFAMLDVHIDTGRKNQIRVHMKDEGHAIIGDKKYHANTDPIKRLGLHAYALEFSHPINHKKFKFYAPIPKLFYQFMEKVPVVERQDKPNKKSYNKSHGTRRFKR